MSLLLAKPLGTPRARPCKGVSRHERTWTLCAGNPCARWHGHAWLSSGPAWLSTPTGGSAGPRRHCGRVCQALLFPLSCNKTVTNLTFCFVGFCGAVTQSRRSGQGRDPGPRTVRCPLPPQNPHPHVIVLNPRAGSRGLGLRGAGTVRGRLTLEVPV